MIAKTCPSPAEHSQQHSINRQETAGGPPPTAGPIVGSDCTGDTACVPKQLVVHVATSDELTAAVLLHVVACGSLGGAAACCTTARTLSAETPLNAAFS
jgi:hypothetical protein